MTISVAYPDEIEFALRERAAATGQDVESLVRQIVIEWPATHPVDATSKAKPKF